MFLSLFEHVYSNQQESIAVESRKIIKVSISIYNAIQKQYPKSKLEWDQYHGIIITGSLSSAYYCTDDDNDDDGGGQNYDWISYLIHQIQKNIHPFRRKTLGVCFGHQIYAHSFSFDGDSSSLRTKLNMVHNNDNNYNDNNMTYDHNEAITQITCDSSREGQAVKCPHGVQVGIRSFNSSSFFYNKRQQHNQNNENQEDGGRVITMLYTHGDMVQSIPKCALSLGGTDTVPIQACAYFSSHDERDMFITSKNSNNNTSINVDYDRTVNPYAITFQGHPEYASQTGVATYFGILTHMKEQKKMSHDALECARKEALENYELIQQNCVNLMQDVMSLLGWL